MSPTLDGVPLTMWQTKPVQTGQVLELAAVRTGVRSYVAISGAIDTPPVLGSRAFDYNQYVTWRRSVRRNSRCRRKSHA